MKKFFSLVISAAMLMAALPMTMGVNADEIMKVACVGDSITQGLGSTPYPQQLQDLLGSGAEVGNFGLWGTTVKNGGERSYMTTENTFQNSLDFAPNVVIIMLGTNDGGGSCTADDEEAFKADYKTLVKAYQDLDTNPDIYLATSPYAYIASNANVNTFVVGWQKELAEELGLPLIDMHTATTDKEMYFQDGLHPNDAGYYLVAQTFYEEIFAGEDMLADITVNTEAGAKVQIDKFFVYADDSGVANVHMAVGERTLKITCNGYSSVYETISVADGAVFDYPLDIQKNLALDATVTAESTSTQYGDMFPEFAIDGDYETRWQASTQVTNGAVTWLALDFGKEVKLDKLIIYWEAARAAVDGYKVQVSRDGEDWNDVQSSATTGVHEDDTVILTETVSTRYLRVYMTKVANEKYNNPSIWEIEAYGPEEDVPPLVGMKGDVNGDGVINSTDFMQVRRHFLKLYEIPEDKQACADVNSDGTINSTDFMQIRRHFLKLYTIEQ